MNFKSISSDTFGGNIQQGKVLLVLAFSIDRLKSHYSNVLTIHTVAAEYLIAMKLRSGRQYKSDLSDILSILAEHEKRGTPITMAQIRKAVTDLYGGWEMLSAPSQAFIENVMQDGRFSDLYEQTVSGERETKELLIQFTQDYPRKMNDSNVDDIAGNLQRKTDRASVLAQLQELKTERDQG